MAFRKLTTSVFDNAGPITAITLALGIAVYFPTKVGDARGIIQQDPLDA